MLQHLDAITHVIRRRQLELDDYRHEVRVMSTRWGSSVISSFLKEEENKKEGIRLGQNPEPVEWNRSLVFREIQGHRGNKILPWKSAKEIVFVANFKNIHWITFLVNLDDWYITVSDCQRELVRNPERAPLFQEPMEVRMNITFVLFHLI